METVDLNFRFNATGNAVPELRRAQGAVKRLDGQIQQSNARMRGFNNGITTMQANTRKFTMGALQQAGYQFGDYAVQIANGTSKMQAFGQQAPQFLQIFGPIGAVVGAGVAIFSAFAVAVQRTKAAAKEATVEVISFGASVRRLQQINTASIAENLSAPAKAAMSEYSGLLDLMREVAEEQRVAALSKFVEEIAPGEGIARLQKQLEAARKNASMLSQSVIDANEGIANAAQSNEAGIINQLQDQRTLRNVILSIQGKTRDEAAKSVSTAIDSLNQSGLMTKELRAQIQAFAEQNGLLLAASEKAKSLTNSVAELGTTILSAVEAQFLLNKGILPPQAAADLIALEEGYERVRGKIKEAADESVRLGKTTLSAVEAQFMLDKGVLPPQAAADLVETKDSVAALRDILNGMGDRSSSGSGRKSIAGGIREAAFVVNNELSPAMMRLKSVQETVSSTFESGFMSMIDGTKSVKDAFKSMASEIIKELLRVYVVQQITGMISNAIGGFGGAPATSLRPVARSFAGGGYTGNGARAGGLDGKGGYMAMIHPRETVVDHTKGQSGGGVTVIQNNTFGSGVSRAEVNAMLPKMVEATKAAVADAKLRGGSYGRSFA